MPRLWPEPRLPHSTLPRSTELFKGYLIVHAVCRAGPLLPEYEGVSGSMGRSWQRILEILVSQVQIHFHC